MNTRFLAHQALLKHTESRLFYVQVYVQVAVLARAFLYLDIRRKKRALTDTALKALKPRDKTYTVSDDRGLYRRYFQPGMVSRYRYRLHGKYEKLTLGKYPALTLKNARLVRDGASQMAAIGESPAQKKQQAKVAGPEDTTLSQFAERFSRRSSSATARTTRCRAAIWTRTFFRTSA